MVHYDHGSDDMGVFAERLRQVRVMRNITQEQLAEMADIARTMVGRYETTDQLPALDTLVRIADALGTSTDYLLGRTDAMDAPFVPDYVAPPKPPRRMPRSVAELESFIREIIEEVKSETPSGS